MFEFPSQLDTEFSRFAPLHHQPPNLLLDPLEIVAGMKWRYPWGHRSKRTSQVVTYQRCVRCVLRSALHSKIFATERSQSAALEQGDLRQCPCRCTTVLCVPALGEGCPVVRAALLASERRAVPTDESPNDVECQNWLRIKVVFAISLVWTLLSLSLRSGSASRGSWSRVVSRTHHDR